MRHLGLAFLFGVAAALGFEPVGAWPLTIFAFAGLIWSIGTASRLRSALARGWWFGLGSFMVGLNWIATAFTYQAAMPAWLGWIAVLLLSLYLAIYPAIAAGIAWRWGGTKPLAVTLWLAAAWILTEWMRANFFTGFAWNPAGTVLIDRSIAPIAALVGSYGLSGVTILLAGLVRIALIGPDRRPALWLAGAAAALQLTAVAVKPQALEGLGPSVRIVQPNIGQELKWTPGFAARNLQRLAELSAAPSRAARRPRLLIWPEAAITELLQDERRLPAYREEVMATRSATAAAIGPNDLLLTGGITARSADGVTATSATNSVFAIDRGGRILARYDKAHLVPYGEYLPMRPILSAIGLSRLAPGDLDFDPGPGPLTLNVPGVGAIGFQLCYEIIFSGEVVDPRRRPGFLFNPSNDAWFGAWGPPQHLAQARLRALEEGLPIVRSTPTGISAVIGPDGALLHAIPLGRAGIIDASLPLAAPPTLFARFGNIAAFLFALVLAVGGLAAAHGGRREAIASPAQAS